MAHTSHYTTRFEADQYYHIYNRGIDRLPIFAAPNNARFFLSKFERSIVPVAELISFAFCLDHFHLLIKIRDLLTLDKYGALNPRVQFSNTHHLVSHQFRSLFIGYAKAYNKQGDYTRPGGVFQSPFKRVLVSGSQNVKRVVTYHHINPQKHGLIKDFRESRQTSYRGYLSHLPTKLDRQLVTDLFGSKEAFIQHHQNAYSRMLHDEPWHLEDPDDGLKGGLHEPQVLYKMPEELDVPFNDLVW